MTDNTASTAPAADVAAPAPRKAKAGPLRPEPPRKLTAGANVADAATGRRFGKVKTILPGDRFVVAWEDGETAHEHRSVLVARFTTTSKRR
ncbi:hypothetical protein SEA_ZETA1847_31 [Microbacterium phage Zeta1847]|uniref:Uncharacterized protein n=1 Tax=Microbacterium phage Zeta1847 TaxID=2201444 RepID=A0A2Z4Q9T5_9CAUD|nr:hypothetical protein HOT46_gp31 [Microbacterium phage Zeta1847]AWY06665.1 hypothetical protein SEA_ZETA1847_31 [Microbacterium phage Zeta1847]